MNTSHQGTIRKQIYELNHSVEWDDQFRTYVAWNSENVAVTFADTLDELLHNLRWSIYMLGLK